MNKSQFNKLYAEYLQEIFRFCYFKLQNKEEAEDVTSEVFIKLYKQDLSKIDNPRAWLYKSTRNHIYDKYIRIDNPEVSSDNDFIEENIDSIHPNPTEFDALTESMIKSIQESMYTLDNTTSDIIAMRIWDEMNFFEIAEIIGINQSAVKMRFYRGIESIKLLISAQSKMPQVNTSLIASGIAAVAITGFFTIGTKSAAAIASTIGSTLGFTLSSMTTANAVATSGGFFSTVAAKILTAGVITTVGIGAGVGGVALYQNQENNNNNFQEETENIPETQIVELKTYRNEVFPTFSFQYDPEKWDVETVERVNPGQDTSSLADYEKNYKISVTHKNEDVTLLINTSASSSHDQGGSIQCYDYSFERIGTTSDTILYRVIETPNQWVYSWQLQDADLLEFTRNEQLTGEYFIDQYGRSANYAAGNVSPIDPSVQFCGIPQSELLTYTSHLDPIPGFQYEARALNIMTFSGIGTGNLELAEEILTTVTVDEIDTENVQRSAEEFRPIEQFPITSLFESERYNISFRYPEELGSATTEFNEEYFNLESVNFENSSIEVSYPYMEGASGWCNIYLEEILSKNGLKFSICLSQNENTEEFYVSGFSDSLEQSDGIIRMLITAGPFENTAAPFRDIREAIRNLDMIKLIISTLEFEIDFDQN